MLLIIDGNNLAHRAKHAFSLSNAGKDVSVTYGFMRVLSSYLRKYRPSSVVVAWDGGIPEFRRQAVPEYKANRKHDDDPDVYLDFIRQVKELAEILPLCGVLSVRHPGAEADDIMSHASKLSEDECLIVTSDKDLLQCVTDKAKVLRPSTGKDDRIYGGCEIQDEFGVRVDQFVDWRALQGDSSDNIPGIYGLGEKTATALFGQFGNLSNIMYKAHCGEVSGKLTERFIIAINEFGAERVGRNLLVMNLNADRVGAKYALFKALEDYQEYDSKSMKRYLVNNNFASLLAGDFLGELRGLDCPQFSNHTRIPMVVKRCSI